MLSLRAAVAASALLCASAQVPSPSSLPPVPYALQQSTCYPEYQSIFHWLNAARTQEYSYDLKPLCGRDRALAVPIPGDTKNNVRRFRAGFAPRLAQVARPRHSKPRARRGAGSPVPPARSTLPSFLSGVVLFLGHRWQHQPQHLFLQPVVAADVL